MIKVSFADICEMMEDSYINPSQGKLTRFDLAMLALYEPDTYDMYLYDFIEAKKMEGKLYVDKSGFYYITNISNNELLLYTDVRQTN